MPLESSLEPPALPQESEIWQQTLDWQPDLAQQAKFQQLYHLTLAGNRQFNLTRITDPQEFWEKHLWDSLRGIKPWLGTQPPKLDSAELESEGQEPDQLQVLRSHATDFTPPILKFPEQALLQAGAIEHNKIVAGQAKDPASLQVIDIGTGAGFPGLPVAIAHPTWNVTLLDSTRKKITFVESLTAALDIQTVQAVSDRAEQLGRDLQHRRKYDLVLIRAVAAAPVCVEYALPF